VLCLGHCLEWMNDVIYRANHEATDQTIHQCFNNWNRGQTDQVWARSEVEVHPTTILFDIEQKNDLRTAKYLWPFLCLFGYMPTLSTPTNPIKPTLWRMKMYIAPYYVCVMNQHMNESAFSQTPLAFSVPVTFYAYRQPKWSNRPTASLAGAARANSARSNTALRLAIKAVCGSIKSVCPSYKITRSFLRSRQICLYIRKGLAQR
jgi:hypothetical protein